MPPARRQLVALALLVGLVLALAYALLHAHGLALGPLAHLLAEGDVEPFAAAIRAEACQ
ncbi:MAG TPA: hypothetical protein VFL91_04930 [Thermomicrobiales bacterium]|nr:hypothetical protein [Thermomicrobiales bacterium]